MRSAEIHRQYRANSGTAPDGNAALGDDLLDQIVAESLAIVGVAWFFKILRGKKLQKKSGTSDRISSLLANLSRLNLSHRDRVKHIR